jgi:hypothetical protein
MKTTGLTAIGGSVSWTLIYNDAGGNAISGANQTGSFANDTAAWTQFSLQIPNKAPPGAATYFISIFVNSTGGISNVWTGAAFTNAY